METLFLDQMMWWISIIEVPVIGALFAMVLSVMRDLSAFRVAAERRYASGTQVRELEARLTAHLLRIEAKLDATALKAEGLSAREKYGP